MPEALLDEVRVGDVFALLPTLPSKSVDIVLTDPPYDWELPARQKAHAELLRVSRGWVIVFCPPENLWSIPAGQHLFWVKPISTKNTSKHYSRFVEEMLVYGAGTWNAHRHWSQYTNVFTDLVDGDGEGFRYEKPVSLLKRLLRNHTNPGDLVLDPFCGSGSVLVAAHELGRHFLGFDRDSKIADVAKRRLVDCGCLFGP